MLLFRHGGDNALAAVRKRPTTVTDFASIVLSSRHNYNYSVDGLCGLVAWSR